MAGRAWSRREFMQRTGQAAGAAWIASSWGGGVLIPEAGAQAGLGENDLAGLEDLLANEVRRLERKFPYASALYSESRGLTILRNDRERRTAPQARVAGVSFRVHDGKSFHESATADLSRDGLRRAARALDDVGPLHRGYPAVDPGPEREADFRVEGAVDPDRAPIERWNEAADRQFEGVRELDPRIRSANFALVAQWRRSVFVDRSRRLRQVLQAVGPRVFLFATEGDRQGRAFLSRRSQAAMERSLLADGDLDDLKRELEDTFRSERIAPGEYTVISAPAVTGLLAHESFGHGVEYDQFIKGRARAERFLGKRVAPEAVQIWDDPSYPGENGSYFFDDEGMLARPTQIVKDGVFVQPLTDLYSATVRPVERTANGRRQNYAHKAYARMSNTFFGNGAMPVPDLMASVEEGILLDGFQSGMEDPHGWGIQFTCRLGYEIRNGEPTGRVFSPVGVGGYVPDILGSIRAVGNRFELVPGTCGKGHKEYVPVSSGGPHLVFRARLG